jgi:hypothetical protein
MIIMKYSCYKFIISRRPGWTVHFETVAFQLVFAVYNYCESQGYGNILLHPGLIFASTPELWTEMRKFSQRTLRDFGFGKRHTMQSVIELEICDIVQEIKEEIKKTDGVLRVRTNFLLSVLNVLWCMIAGQRYAHDDPKLVKMLEKNFAMTKAQTFIDPVLLAFPFLRTVCPKLFKIDLIMKTYEESHKYSQVRPLFGKVLEQVMSY